MGMYLWHIPLVGIAAGAAILLGFDAAPLSPLWWAVHLLVVVVVVPAAWFLAGLAAVPEKRLSRLHGHGWPGWGCAIGGFAVLNMAATGFGTWWGSGAAGLPSSAAVNLVLVIGAYWLVSPVRVRSGVPQM